jgi:flagellar basal-body rod protein FlgF
MSKGLWPAVSGAVARGQQVEVIANNLANVNTNGFKKDDVSFQEYLSANEKMTDLTEEVPRLPIKDKDLHRMEGRDQSFVILKGTHSIHKTGGLKVTDNALDVALDGPGFFEISTPNGIKYTRAGSFKVSGEGRIETADGFPVLSSAATAGQPVRTLASEAAGRYINISDREGPLQINDSGEIYIGEEKVADLSIVEFKDVRGLQKSGNLNFENKKPDILPIKAERTLAKQGMIESSNVNPVEEISNLIRANRMFEQDLKAMKTVNEMMQKEVNDLGKI